jgi:hypothetical protein
MRTEELSKYTSGMLEEISGIIDKDGTYPIPPTQQHPAHQTGDILVDDGSRYAISSVPLPDGRMVILRRMTPYGESEKLEVTVFDTRSQHEPRVFVSRQNKEGTTENFPSNSQRAVDVAMTLTSEFGKLNGNVLRVINHRGIVYRKPV